MEKIFDGINIGCRMCINLEHRKVSIVNKKGEVKKGANIYCINNFPINLDERGCKRRAGK